MRPHLIRIAIALPLAAFASLAVAQALKPTTYRCVGKDGKKYYGSTIPRECLGQPIEQLSAQGTVIRRMGGQETEEQRAAREAEAAKKREEDALAKEEARRNRALLATYTSEKDIEEARARALKENQTAIKGIEARIADIKKRQAGFTKEMEFYKEPTGKAGAKPKAAPKAPPKLLDDIHQADVDLQAQQNLLETKKKEDEGINAKYDEDKKRYLELTKPAGR